MSSSAVQANESSASPTARLPAAEVASTRAARKRQAQLARADVLAVAAEEFAEHGFSGARIERISSRTRTTKRSIYYYFGDKEGLYCAVLKQACRAIHRHAARLDFTAEPPLEALASYVTLTLSFWERREQIVRLLLKEDLKKGAYLKAQEEARALRLLLVRPLRDICRRGQAEGVIRTEVDPLDLCMTVAAMALYRTSGGELPASASQAQYRRLVVEMVLRSAVEAAPPARREGAPARLDALAFGSRGEARRRA